MYAGSTALCRLMMSSSSRRPSQQRGSIDFILVNSHRTAMYVARRYLLRYKIFKITGRGGTHAYLHTP